MAPTAEPRYGGWISVLTSIQCRSIPSSLASLASLSLSVPRPCFASARSSAGCMTLLSSRGSVTLPSPLALAATVRACAWFNRSRRYRPVMV